MKRPSDTDIDGLLARYGADRNRWPKSAVDSVGRGTAAAEAEAVEIDKVLGLATPPPLPEGAMVRLLERLPDRPSATIVAFRPKIASKDHVFRYAALPLAASLLLGIYLGARGTLDTVFPVAITGTVASSDETPDDDLGGVGELDAYVEDNVT